MCDSESEENPVLPRFGSEQQIAIIDDIELTEASGMVASISHADKYWVINDRGNPAKIFLIDDKANITKSYWLENAINYDWEDLAIFTDQSDGKPKVVVADIGDNQAIRDHIRLYIFDESEIINNTDTIIYNIETLNMKYEDGPRDADALFIDPLNSDIYIITKREFNSRLYRGALDVSVDTVHLKFQMAFPFFLVTSADITVDGTEILVKNYNTVFYWQRNHSESIPQAFQNDYELLPYTPEPQGESIAWKSDGSGFYTLSERSGSEDQILYFYKRN